MIISTGPRATQNEFLAPPTAVRRIAAAIYQRLPTRVCTLVRPLARRALPAKQLDDALHPERLAVLPFLTGCVLEIGCGHRKTIEASVAVDLVPRGKLGTTGNARGRYSQANVSASGGALPFRSGSFDTVLARHNLEHYVDLVEVLSEWRQVLRPQGRLVVVVPDEENYTGRTVELDPTHYHAFSRTSLSRIVELLGFRVDHVETAVDRWSFLLVASVNH